MKQSKKVKRKISFKGLIFLILILYLLGSTVYYLLTKPIKNIEVEGNKYVSTAEILSLSGLDKNPTILQVSRLKISKELKTNPLIKSVSVYKNYLGKVKLVIEENRPLFINKLNNNVVLSSGDTIDDTTAFLGLPILVNYVPQDIYEDFIKGLSKIDVDIVEKISEIEYSPDKSEEVVFDENRFLLRMNDKNRVYINTPNILKLNNYNRIYSEVGGGGTLLLDSNSSNYIFNAK